MNNLREDFESLFKIIKEEFPILYDEIVLLANNKQARLSDGKDIIAFYVKGNKIKITNRNTKYILSTGRFTKESIIGLLDGNLTLENAVKKGGIDCIGKKSDVLLFYKILRILLYASARSVKAYEIWRNMT